MIKVSEQLGFLFVLAVYVGVVLLVGSTRSYPGHGVETDFVGGFVAEAKRLLAGEPLQSFYHPPFYSMVVAATYVVFPDWFRTGLLISLGSGAVALSVAYLLFGMLGGRAVAWGGVAPSSARPCS